METAVRSRLERYDVDAFPDRRIDGGGVALEVRHDLVAKHEAVRVMAVIRVTWQLYGPVRCDEAKAVPAAAPRVSDAASFEHDVVDARPRELVADSQPGLTATNDDH